MKIRRSKTPPTCEEKQVEQDREERLSAAEGRANEVYEKAQWLRTIVARRDQANHWQESVNRLFSGGTP